MSLKGQLQSNYGVTLDGAGNILLDGSVIASGGVFGGSGGGKLVFLDPANGSDTASGKTPGEALASLSTAYGKLRTGKNDTVVLIGDGSTSATARLTETLTWSKNACNLIGITAPTFFASRARISHLTTATTNINPLITVSGSGCIFANFSMFQGIGQAATDEKLIDVTGDRNLFHKIHFGGMGHATGADRAGSYILKVTGGENEFRECVIGLDTISRGAANASVKFASGALRNVFLGCIFPMYADTATTQLFVDANSANAFGGGLGALFKNCTFYAEQNIGSATTPAAPVVSHASSNGTILFDGCGFENVTAIAAASTRVRSVNMPSQAAAQGIASNSGS